MTAFSAGVGRDLAYIVAGSVFIAIVVNLPQIAARIAEWLS